MDAVDGAPAGHDGDSAKNAKNAKKLIIAPNEIGSLKYQTYTW